MEHLMRKLNLSYNLILQYSSNDNCKTLRVIKIIDKIAYKNKKNKKKLGMILDLVWALIIRFFENNLIKQALYKIVEKHKIVIKTDRNLEKTMKLYQKKEFNRHLKYKLFDNKDVSEINCRCKLNQLK